MTPPRIVHVPRSDVDDLFRMVALAAAADKTNVRLVTVDDDHWHPESNRKYIDWLSEAGATLPANR